MLTNSYNDQNRPCKVMVRCRPLNKKEVENGNPIMREKIVRKNEDTLYLYEPQLSQSSPIRFNFDKIFLETEQNLQVFAEVKVVIDDLLQGFNTAILAYGITGAGKSFTMFGGGSQQGIVTLVLKHLLALEGVKVKMSLIELYNQQLRDLLSDNPRNLSILEDNQGNIVISDVSEHQLLNDQNLDNILKSGTSKRVTASTLSNNQSSRSHCIIQVSVQQITNQGSISSKLFLVDLAGSERASQNKGLRLQQGANINKSLLSLSNCIIQLSQNSNFVPYRDSKLTRILKQCLGGNSKTIIIACISPSYLNYDETVNTLKYASKAARIRRQVIPNARNDDKNQLEFLRRQVNRLRQLMKENTRPLSPHIRRESSLWKTPKNISPTSTRIKNRLERENQLLRNSLKQKQNQVKEKDETIKKLSREISMFRQNSSLQTRDVKENIASCNQSKVRRVDVKKPQIPVLQIIREKTRPFKNKLKYVYKQYQSMAKKDRLPLKLAQMIQQLSTQFSQGNIILNQQYTNVLMQLKKLADFSMH